jgi:hypothetical protein
VRDKPDGEAVDFFRSDEPGVFEDAGFVADGHEVFGALGLSGRSGEVAF